MLALATALKARLESNGALNEWAAAQGWPAPRIILGYRRPRTAQDWPFVAIVPVGSRMDISLKRHGRFHLAIVSGCRSENLDGDTPEAMAQVWILDDIVVSDLMQSRALSTQQWSFVAVSSLVTDTESHHPNYQIERIIEFSGHQLSNR